MKATAILLGVILCLTVFADTKTETELATRVRELVAEREALMRDKAALAAALSLSAATSGKSPLPTPASAALNADANAAISQGIAASNGRIAIEAAEGAKKAADDARLSNESANTRLLYTLGFGFLTLMAPMILSYRKETRTRRWAVEDAMRKDRAAKDNHEVTVVKLDEVKAEATRAYQEANTVNQKIERIGMQMKDGHPLNSEEKG